MKTRRRKNMRVKTRNRKKEAKKVSEKVKGEEKKVEVSRAGDGDECGEK